MLFNFLAMDFEVFRAIMVALVILAVICALIITIVVLIQPSNSNGISALGGATDTFYSKNKSKTLESGLRKLTVICLAVLVVIMVVFALLLKFSGKIVG
ncbi:MAG: preprotein translocase subunit SecG [Christensenellaceae bacterium]